MCGAQSFMSLSVFCLLLLYGLFVISFDTFCLLHKHWCCKAPRSAAKHRGAAKHKGVLQSTNECCKAQVFVCVCTCVLNHTSN